MPSKPIIRLVLPLLLITSLACEFVLGEPAATAPGAEKASALVRASEGGMVVLADGAALLIPPGALQHDTQVSLEAVQGGGPSLQSPNATAGAGKVYDVKLGTDQLLSAVALELPFDPARMPSNVEPAQVFLATFDEESGTWVYAGGTVDLSRNVVSAAITHASWWQPATWNWTALPVLLTNTLSLNFVATFEAGKLMMSGCEQNGTYVNVERLANTTLIQGCIDKDDPSQPMLRLVNPELIPYEVSSSSSIGGKYFSPQMLSPGGTVTFVANTKDPSPLIVDAAVTQESSKYLAMNLILAALPGLSQLSALSGVTVRGQQIECLLNRLAYQTDILSIGLAVSHNDAAAAIDSFTKLFMDQAKMLELIKAASECRFEPASTWSPSGLAQIAQSSATLLTEFEYFVRIAADRTQDKIAFNWTPPAGPSPTARPTNPPSVSLLQGTVLQLSNCRYGPDYPYLYKYGVRVGTKMEVIGRDADGNWLQVRAVGGNNPCWIKAVQMQVDGDVMGLPDAYPTTTGLPISPFFERITLTGVSSCGGEVCVTWLEHEIRSDLGTEQGFEYIVEVWTCVNGKPNFSAIGTNDTSASFSIDNSCGQASHADVIGEDKEGFSIPTIITLP